MPSAGYELTIPASKRPQTHALDRAATGIGPEGFILRIYEFYVYNLHIYFVCIP
jgi:hypothetical protein